MKHVKGILLFGPPGTGKTLMARYWPQLFLIVYVKSLYTVVYVKSLYTARSGVRIESPQTDTILNPNEEPGREDKYNTRYLIKYSSTCEKQDDLALCHQTTRKMAWLKDIFILNRHCN